MGHVLEGTGSGIAIQAVACGLLDVGAADLVFLRVEHLEDPVTGRGRHVRYVQIEIAVVVVVPEGNPHTEAGIGDAPFARRLAKRGTIVDVKPVLTEIVGNVEVLVTVSIDIGRIPRRSSSDYRRRSRLLRPPEMFRHRR